MELLAKLIVEVLKLLIPALFTRTAEDAQPQPELRNKLNNTIKATWCIFFCLLFIGCTRTIYVPHGEPVRLRETITNAKVWVKDSDGNTIAGVLDLHEGWYCLPMTEDN
jgi:hypothetical protein